MKIASIDQLQGLLREQRYISDRGLSTALYLSLKLQRPLFVEGEAGVGKTEIAKVVADFLETELIRLQCYEGLDVNQAVYEWNYTRQMMHLRLAETRGDKPTEAELFGPEFLLDRPLLRAIRASGKGAPVLLIDEVDRSDDAFEAYLLEVLSDFQISIPEIGTICAQTPPVVIITSNRTREVHDALKRRCLYFWIDYPTFQKELAIVQARLPQVADKLARQVTLFVQELRDLKLYKVPGVAETLDWTTALVALNTKVLEQEIIDETLGVILKYKEDVERVKGNHVDMILKRVHATG